MRRAVTMLLVSVIVAGTALASGGGETAKAGPRTVTFMTWFTQGEENQLLDKFRQENPSIKVEVEAIDGSKYREILKARITAGDLPDVVTTFQTEVEFLMREGWALEVTNEPSVRLLDKAPGVKEFLTYKGGKIYSFPHDGGAGYGYMYYNKLIFKKVGLPVPYQPATLAAFEADLEKIKQAGFEPMLLGAKDLWVPGMIASQWFESQQIGTVAKANGGKVMAPAEAVYKGVTKWSDVYRFAFQGMRTWWDKGYISKNSRSMTWPESFAAFAEGSIPIFPQGPWVPGMDQATKADPAKLDLGCFALPQQSVDGKYYITAGIGKVIMINAKTKQLDGAKTLFNWLCDEKNLAYWLTYRKNPSFVLPVAGYSPAPIFADWDKFTKSYTPAVLMWSFPNAPGFDVGKAVGDMFAGASPEEALKSLDAFYVEHKGEIKIPEK